MSATRLDAARALKLAAALVGRRNAVPLRRGPRLALAPHPSAPDPTNLAGVRLWVRAAARPTAIDLFSGAGGLSLGLTRAGFSVLAAADIDAVASETYLANLGGLRYTGDLSDVSEFLDHLRAWEIDEVDLVAGGVPCQPFSRAGRSKIRSLVDAKIRPSSDGRADLWQSFVSVVRFLRPRAVLLENVPDLAQWNEGDVLIGLFESLRELGYQTDARILNAYDYGVPQHRARLFLVGFLGQRAFSWPSAQAPSPTLWDAISDLPIVPPGQRLEVLPYETPLTELQRRLRNGVPPESRHVIHDHITRDVRPDDAEAFAGLVEGGTYRDVPLRLRRYRSDIFKDKYNRLSRSELSRTITAHLARDGYWYIHPVQDRTLSVREAARIQTFPDSFRFSGEPSLRYRQIGNAVPPLLAEAVGRSVAEGLTDNKTQRRHGQPSFRGKLLAWSASSLRPHPWRSSGNPWIVLIGEMVLRRLRQDQVESPLRRLTELAPDPSTMQLNMELIRQEFANLGDRLEGLCEVADELVKRHDGRVPRKREHLTALPGVGDYLANAVLCFGFGESAILMDNVTQRLGSRVMGRDPARRLWQMRLDLYRLAGPEGAGAEFNTALLELGNQICKTSKPSCLVCPVAAHCASFGADFDA